MRIGIFGGAFDPVHNGHLLLAECCREQCGLDQVWFVPTRNPPHKDASALSTAADRVDMLQFATAGVPEFVVSRIELDRDETSWTVDTLKLIRESNPEDDLFLLIGADSLRDLPGWREPEAITELATIVAVNRGDSSLNPLLNELSEEIRSRVKTVHMPAVALSATEIRERARTGHSLRFQVPRAVEEFIRQRNLYR